MGCVRPWAYDDGVAIGNDITGRARALLPQLLVEKTAEIDASLGHEVTFRVVDALQGGAHGAVNLEDGVVWLPQRSIIHPESAFLSSVVRSSETPGGVFQLFRTEYAVSARRTSASDTSRGSPPSSLKTNDKSSTKKSGLCESSR